MCLYHIANYETNLVQRETNPDNENYEDGDSESESARPPIRKQARVTFAPRPQPQMDIISLLPNVDDDVVLTYVPCANDVKGWIHCIICRRRF